MPKYVIVLTDLLNQLRYIELSFDPAISKVYLKKPKYGRFVLYIIPKTRTTPSEYTVKPESQIQMQQKSNQ